MYVSNICLKMNSMLCEEVKALMHLLTYTHTVMHTQAHTRTHTYTHTHTQTHMQTHIIIIIINYFTTGRLHLHDLQVFMQVLI